MRTPQLGTEVFVAALAVLSATACSKRAESGGAVPDNAPAAVSPTATAAASAQGAQPTTATLTPPPAQDPAPTATAKAAAAVDAGKEIPRPKTGAAPAKPAGDHACGATPSGGAGKGNAACGASGCSPEMKKGK